MRNDTTTLPDVLSIVLRATPPADRVLSVYLDTSPARIDGKACLIAFRDLAKSLRKKLVEQEHEAFEAAVAQAETYLGEHTGSSKPGLALFASGSSAYFYAVALPGSPPEEMTWEREAVAQPIVQMLEDGARVGIALFDAREARIFTMFLGEIEERRTIHDDVPGKHHGGGWAALAESRATRHRVDHLVRHAQRANQELLELAASHPYNRLILGGPTEARSLFRDQLPPALARLVIGSIAVEMFASEAEIVRAAHELVTTVERRGELAIVDRLLDGETTDRVTLGLTETFDALGDGRVHTLVLVDTFAAVGGECPGCRRLVAGPGPCPVCALAIVPVADLGDQAIHQAIERGATVEIVSGDAALLLATRGGIGAWTRFAP